MIRVLLLLSIAIMCVAGTSANDKEYILSARSEKYNTRYIDYIILSQPVNHDTTVYINGSLPTSFVIESCGLEVGEKAQLVYNGTCELSISRKTDRYVVNGTVMKTTGDAVETLSLYFVNERVVVYAGEKRLGQIPLHYDHTKRVGLSLKKGNRSTGSYLCCYEPCKFKEIDYGRELDDGLYKRLKQKLSKQNVEEDYSLTFPSDVCFKSPRSIRFEYRFEDSKKDGKSKTQRGRSEISGVQSSVLTGKWIIEFDFYVPSETHDDDKRRDCITQLHDYSTVALSPAFSVGMLGGELYCRLRGDSIPVEQWKQRNVPASGTHITTLGYLKKDTWHHVKIFLKLAYQRSMKPLTAIWLDSQKVFESNFPNCYNYKPKKEGKYDYLKFGIYKSSWLGLKRRPLDTDRRIYYFDNYKVKY